MTRRHIVAVLLLLGIATGARAATPTQTGTLTPRATRTETITKTATATRTPTLTGTVTQTWTRTSTATLTPAPLNTATMTRTGTAGTPIATWTATRTATATLTQTVEPTTTGTKLPNAPIKIELIGWPTPVQTPIVTPACVLVERADNLLPECVVSELGGGTGGSGDISDVWACATGNCNALTAAAGDTLDAGAADSAKPCARGTALPGTCAVGDCFQDTDSGGSELYVCTATDTWTKVLGAGAQEIVNADISASAAIARSKLATATPNHVVINDGSGALSSEAQLAVSRGGTGLSAADNNRVMVGTGTAWFASELPNCTAVGSHLNYNNTNQEWTCTNTAAVALTLAGTSGTPQPINNGDTVTLAAGTGITTTAGATDTVTIAATLGTDITSTEIVDGTIANIDVATDAALARSKLAAGTANHVLINDSGGAMSSEAALALSRGGTNQATWTAGDCVRVKADGTALESAGAACGAGSLTGSGTDNYLARWNSTDALQDSSMVMGDDGQTALAITKSGTAEVFRATLNSTSDAGVRNGYALEGQYFDAGITGNQTGTARGVYGSAYHQNDTYTANAFYGGDFVATTASDAATTSLTGVHGVADKASGSGAVTTATGVRGEVTNGGTGSIGTGYGVYASVSGAVDNAYGIYVANSSGTFTNDWSIYTAGAEPVSLGGPLTLRGTSGASTLAAPAGGPTITYILPDTAPADDNYVLLSTTDGHLSWHTLDDSHFHTGLTITGITEDSLAATITPGSGFSFDFFTNGATLRLKRSDTEPTADGALQIATTDHCLWYDYGAGSACTAAVDLANAFTLPQTITHSTASEATALTTTETATTSTIAHGAQLRALGSGSNLVAGLFGANVLADSQGAGGTYLANGIESVVKRSGTGVIGEADVFTGYVSNTGDASAAITAAVVFKVQDGVPGAGGIGTQVGVEVPYLDAASTNIGLSNASTTVYPPGTTVALAAAGDNLVCDSTYKRFTTAAGTTTMSDNPLIPDGQVGQVCTWENISDTVTKCIKLTDGQGVQNIGGGDEIVCPVGGEAASAYAVTYQYDGTDWVEIARAGNSLSSGTGFDATQVHDTTWSNGGETQIDWTWSIVGRDPVLSASANLLQINTPLEVLAGDATHSGLMQRCIGGPNNDDLCGSDGDCDYPQGVCRAYLAGLEQHSTQTINETGTQVKFLHPAGTIVWNENPEQSESVVILKNDLIERNQPGENRLFGLNLMAIDRGQWVCDGAACTMGNYEGFTAYPIMRTENSGTLDVTLWYNFSAVGDLGSGVTVTDRVGYRVADPIGAGTVTNNVGVKIEALDGTTSSVGLSNADSTVYPPTTVQHVSAGTAITVDGTVVQVDAVGGNVTMTATPTIASPVTGGATPMDGQWVVLVNTGSIYTITLQDESVISSNLRLPGPAYALRPRKAVTLVYDGTVGNWVLASASAPGVGTEGHIARWYGTGGLQDSIATISTNGTLTNDFTSAAVGTSTIPGLTSTVTGNPASGTPIFYGGLFHGESTATAASGAIYNGVETVAQCFSANGCATLYGAASKVNALGTGAVGTGYGYWTQIANTTGQSMDAYGVYVADSTVGGAGSAFGADYSFYSAGAEAESFGGPLTVRPFSSTTGATALTGTVTATDTTGSPIYYGGHLTATASGTGTGAVLNGLEVISQTNGTGAAANILYGVASKVNATGTGTTGTGYGVWTQIVNTSGHAMDAYGVYVANSTVGGAGSSFGANYAIYTAGDEGSSFGGPIALRGVSSGVVTISAGDSPETVTYTWPDAKPTTTGQVLKTTDSGVLFWGPDVVGNHQRACASTGSVAAGAVANVCVTWTAAFGDTTYTVMGSVYDANTADIAALTFHHGSSKTTGGACAVVQNQDASNARTGTLCMEAQA